MGPVKRDRRDKMGKMASYRSQSARPQDFKLHHYIRKGKNLPHFHLPRILASLTSILIRGLNVAILKPFSILGESGEKFGEIVPKVGSKDRNLEIRQVCFALH